MPVSDAVYEQEELMKQWKESNDRITNPYHVRVEHFLEHKKLEGVRNDILGSKFSCDRILHAQNMFLQFQMAYHPVQKRTFVIARTKTSRYDTVSTDRERQIRAEDISYIMQRRRKKQEANGRKAASNTMFLYNRQTNMWDRGVIGSFVKANRNVSVDKTLPFFTTYDERARRHELAGKQKAIKETVAIQSRESRHEENTSLLEDSKYYLQEENYLQMLIERKEASGISFLRKMNYAVDIQKNEMFAYYRAEQEAELAKREAQAGSDEEEES
ncbi:MAG: hypothetical protein R3Y67_07970 [Eubacteriales bacterium]